MTITLAPIAAVHLSCNDPSIGDPAPSGAWVEGPGGGNGCQDGFGNAISSSGDVVSVRVEYTYQLFTPLASSLFGSVPLSGSATMIIN